MELCAYFAALRSRLPSSEDDSLEIREADLPEPCTELESAGTWWSRVVKSYNDAPIEVVQLHTDRESACALGLLLVSRLFRPSPECLSVRLTAELSDLDELVVLSPSSSNRPGLQTTVHSVTYEPGELERFPLSGRAYSFDWPSIVLPCDNLKPGRPEILLRRSRIEIGGTANAYFDLAQALLDLGREGQTANEFDLECFDMGNGGVRAGSCELKVWAPGSIGYLVPGERGVDSGAPPDLQPLGE